MSKDYFARLSHTGSKDYPYYALPVSKQKTGTRLSTVEWYMNLAKLRDAGLPSPKQAPIIFDLNDQLLGQLDQANKN